jgi:predicted nucleic acid-binding protein
VTWLRDVSARVAHLVQSHEHHARVNAWWPGRTLAVCPITELGFLRVACALGSTMEDARRMQKVDDALRLRPGL